MPGPMQSGIFIYAKVVSRVASFYDVVLACRGFTQRLSLWY